MGLSIRNLNKELEEKFRKCIALLGEEYSSLNYTIYFYENPEKLQVEQNTKPDMEPEQYMQILNGKTKTAGVTISDKEKIKIFLFQFGDINSNPKEVIDLIGNLYHEIRHAWQNENNLFQNEEKISTIDGNFESYLKLPSEKDAYRFQIEQLEKHGERIIEIFFGFKRKFTYQIKPEIKKAIYS